MLHGAFPPSPPTLGPTSPASTSVPRRRCRASSACSLGRRPGSAASRPDPQGLADLHPGGWAHVLSRRRARDGRGRGPRDSAGGRAARRRRVSTTSADRRRGRRGAARIDDAVWGLDGQRALAIGSTRAATSMPLSRRARTSCTRCSRPSASSMPSSNPSQPRRPGPTARRHRGPACLSGGQGVWDDRTTIARCSGSTPGASPWSSCANGGAFGGKEDMANQAQTALAAWLLARPVKCTLSREESLLHPPEAPPRSDGVLGGM
jgi:hypothetical protein